MNPNVDLLNCPSRHLIIVSPAYGLSTNEEPSLCGNMCAGEEVCSVLYICVTKGTDW